MITKEIIETIISVDPYQRSRFKAIGLLDYSEMPGAPSEFGGSTDALLPYASLFKGRHLSLMRLDNGTLVTYLIVALHKRTEEPVRYTPRKEVHFLVVRGRHTVLLQENIPTLAVLAKDEMTGKNDPAWVRDGVIQFLSILPIIRNDDPDVFAKFGNRITLNMDLNKPFNFHKNQIPIKKWQDLVTGLLKSSFLK